MRIARGLTGALVAAVAVSLSVGLTSAVAAAPGNDTIGGATVAGLGFSETLDTTEATTDLDDVAANADCGAPATDASVWYSYTAAASGGVVVDVGTSSFSPGVIVVSGSPGAFVLETCGPGAVAFAASADTTYHILAFDYQGDGGGNGGTLRISFAATPPPPTLDVTVNPTGYVNAKTGVATITGTITCTDADFVAAFSQLRQRVGVRAVVNGFGGIVIGGPICTGSPQPWSSDVYPEGGKFAGGKSASFTTSFACGPVLCTEGYTVQTVKLRGGGKA
jgi:hypothetical protein